MSEIRVDCEARVRRSPWCLERNGMAGEGA